MLQIKRWTTTLLEVMQVMDQYHLLNLDLDQLSVDTNQHTIKVSLGSLLNPQTPITKQELGKWLLRMATHALYNQGSLEHLEAIKHSEFRSFLHQCFNEEGPCMGSLLKHQFLDINLSDESLYLPPEVFFLDAIEEDESEVGSTLDCSDEWVELNLHIQLSEEAYKLAFWFSLRRDQTLQVARELTAALSLNSSYAIPIAEAIDRKLSNCLMTY